MYASMETGTGAYAPVGPAMPVGPASVDAAPVGPVLPISVATFLMLIVTEGASGDAPYTFDANATADTLADAVVAATST